jgi:predicted dehydrogenase
MPNPRGTAGDTQVIGVASPTPGNATSFAKRHGIPQAYTDYRRLLENLDIKMVIIGVPNHLHCEVVCAAADAGKHVVIEKPLCLNLAEADRMISACQRASVRLMYAEELGFSRKYVRLKQLLDSGAVGQPTLIKQSEKHDGPLHADHFWDVERSGGGVAMDMGCHAIEFFRWMLDRPPVKSVYAHLTTQVHGGKTHGDDNAIPILEFANGVVCLAEESWTKLGGMDDRAEVHGSGRVACADLLSASGYPGRRGAPGQLNHCRKNLAQGRSLWVTFKSVSIVPFAIKPSAWRGEFGTKVMVDTRYEKDRCRQSSPRGTSSIMAIFPAFGPILC